MKSLKIKTFSLFYFRLQNLTEASSNEIISTESTDASGVCEEENKTTAQVNSPSKNTTTSTIDFNIKKLPDTNKITKNIYKSPSLNSSSGKGNQGGAKANTPKQQSSAKLRQGPILKNLIKKQMKSNLPKSTDLASFLSSL